MQYYRLSKSFRQNEMLPINRNPYDVISDFDSDWYASLYKYNEDHYQQWQKTKSFSGMSGVTTNIIFFDFDSKSDVEKARKDTLELLSRLMKYDIPQKSIQVAFSGSKGFSVHLKTNSLFTPEELQRFTSNLADGLSSYDPVVYDSQRIVRLLGTKHQDSGLYKIPLTFDELSEHTSDEIKEEASNKEEAQNRLNRFEYSTIDLPESMLSLKAPKLVEVKKKETLSISSEINFNNKPKWLTACKYVLQEGHFDEGQRREAILIMAATYKAQGFNFELVWRMLKGVAEKQSQLNNSERIDDEEIYRVAKQIFDPKWKGGQYTCKSHPILKAICETLGSKACRYTDYGDKPITMSDVTPMFKEYVKNIDQNTILTGLTSIDENVFLSTGVNAAILGAPGGGKTALGLNILNNTSKAGVRSVFASLDMHRNRMYEKVMYKLSGLDRKTLYDRFKNDKEGDLVDRLKQEFGNVNFYHRSGPTVSDIRDYIVRCQDESGEKIKLVMLDYFERVMSDYSDANAASAKIAGELQDLVNDLDVALITLVQPNKIGISAGGDSPLYNYSSIKGASFLSQSFRIIMSLWRPFYNPKDFSQDHFMQMAVLKNDLGELNEFVFGWDGPKGEISELTTEQKDDFWQLLEEKKSKDQQRKNPWD